MIPLLSTILFMLTISCALAQDGASFYLTPCSIDLIESYTTSPIATVEMFPYTDPVRKLSDPFSPEELEKIGEVVAEQKLVGFRDYVENSTWRYRDSTSIPDYSHFRIDLMKEFAPPDIDSTDLPYYFDEGIMGLAYENYRAAIHQYQSMKNQFFLKISFDSAPPLLLQGEKMDSLLELQSPDEKWLAQAFPVAQQEASSIPIHILSLPVDSVEWKNEQDRMIVADLLHDRDLKNVSVYLLAFNKLYTSEEQKLDWLILSLEEMLLGEFHFGSLAPFIYRRFYPDTSLTVAKVRRGMLDWFRQPGGYDRDEDIALAYDFLMSDSTAQPACDLLVQAIRHGRTLPRRFYLISIAGEPTGVLGIADSFTPEDLIFIPYQEIEEQRDLMKKAEESSDKDCAPLSGRAELLCRLAQQLDLTDCRIRVMKRPD